MTDRDGRSRHARLLAVVIGSVLASTAGLVVAAPVGPVRGLTMAVPTAATLEGSLLAAVNADRTAIGLVPLRIDPRLRAIADTRSATLASLGVLTHAAAGDLPTQLTAAGVTTETWGEDLGWTTYAWGTPATGNLLAMWRASPEHWALLMSATLNYVGVGLALRSSDGATYASVVFTESPDHTPPVARVTSANRSGTTISFSWRGWDVPLQTHTTGLATFDVLYRASGGYWRVIRSRTTTTSVTIANRPPGHSYYLSVRARDRAGNLSSWSAPLHVWVP